MINKQWHDKNKMPKNATTEQRLKWHLEHQKRCACRPVPMGLQPLLRERKKAKPLRGMGNSESNRMRRRLISTLKLRKKALQERYRVKEIGIFGSYARNEQKKRSDVDVLVDFFETPDMLTFVSLANDLESVLKKKVDLVRKPVLRAELRERILKETIYI